MVMRSRFLPILVAICVLAIDQASKALVVSRLGLYESRPVFSGLLHLTRVENPGVAFGLFAGRPSVWGVAAVAALAVILWVALRRFSYSPPVLWGMGFTGGGALGNLIDRLRIGKVIDFVELPVWPVFNLADVAIVLGVGLFLWAGLRTEAR